MADQEGKNEISKEVLAPQEGIREDLVATAVKFLQNPKVQQSALSQKKAFLQRKGLTTEEIEIAVQRAGVQQSNVSSTPENAGYQSQVAMQQGAAPSVPDKVEEMSRWIKARKVLAMVAMVSGISYAAYRLYKEFLGPWLFGYQSADKRLEKLEKMVAESVTNVNSTLTSIEDTLGKQQEKLQMLSHDVNSKMDGSGGSLGQTDTRLSELKTELSTIKGLLLNRRQFPAMPTSTPVLPAWQLASNSGEGNSNSKGTDDSDTGETPKIAFSPTPAGDAPESPVQQETSTDFTINDKNDLEKSMSEKDSGIVAKNKDDDSAEFENEADGNENEARTEKVGQSSEVNATSDNKDSEGNDSID